MSDAPARRRILTLDDEPVARGIMGRYLGLHGFDTVEAGSVADAVTALKRERVDAVILDIKLGEQKTGLDVLRALRALPGLDRLPAIILTGKVLTEEEELAITRERAFLPKAGEPGRARRLPEPHPGDGSAEVRLSTASKPETRTRP
jgi:CheY-like chemotaxis protein